MRILSISGQNIASLAERFEIDLTAAPLRDAGLFAITGETGAGKSSILDAMCLALYGDAPRLATGAASDEIPDPSGDVLKAKDSRAILRRGAVQGWAEVRFAALDGAEYIARWQARRARDKADGKLQNIARSVARGADLQVLASQTTAVTEQIIALTGLTYEEFRRTVLLAQGDFDAFLRADTNERAGLLEKVTGTGLYRAVSTRVFERADAARQAHEALAVQRGAHRLLAPEEQAALAAERTALQAELAAGASARAALQADLDRHARLAEAEAQRAQAQALATAAQEAVQAEAPARAHLAQLDQAEPLRPLWQRRAEAAQRLATSDQALVGKASAQVAALAEAEGLQNKSAQAQQGYAEKEFEFKALGPQWDAAAALDAQIEAAKAELVQAEAAALPAQDLAARSARELANLRAAEAAAQHALGRAEAHLAEAAPARPLAAQWAQAQADLAAIAAAQTAMAAAQREAEAATEARKTAQNRADRLMAELQQVRAEEAALQEQARARAEAIAALEAQHPPQAARALLDQTQALANLQRAAEEAEAAAEALGHGRRQAQTAQAGAQQATQEITAAQRALTHAEAQVAALAAPAEQADLASSAAAQALRLRLEQGQPCPVCGALEHPTAAQDGALAALAARLRDDLSTARAAAAQARGAQLQAERALAQHAAQEAQARASIDQAQSRSAAAEQLWAQVLASGAFPELPATPVLATVTAAEARVAQAAKAENRAQEALSESRKALQSLTNTREALHADLTAKAEAREALARDLAQAEQALARAQSLAESQRSLSAHHRAGVAPLLAPLGVALEAPDLLAQLSALVARQRAAEGAQEQAQAHLAQLAPQLAAQASKAEAADKQAQIAQAQVQARAQHLASLQQERAPLLGGAPTAGHRSQFNEQRKEALAARDAAQAALTEALRQAAAAASAQQAAEADRAAAAAQSHTAETALQQAIASTGLDPATLAALFALPPEAAQTLRETLRAKDDALTAARAAAEARAQDVARLQAALPALPAETLTEALTAQIATLEATLTSRAQRQGAIDNQLATEAETRKTLAGLEAEITRAQAELEVWQAVNKAIGAKNGDRFARFAQSITLDVLVEAANRHLAELNPRYRLRRAAELALQVEDLDMGGEARATRSLSGGERFLVSLALALALSRMGGKGGLAATLFIDEGFGALDATSLDLAIDALENLQSQGRQVGVISHVEALKDRIPVQVVLRKQGGGKSRLLVTQSGS